jgi:hypothetical protein
VLPVLPVLLVLLALPVLVLLVLLPPRWLSLAPYAVVLHRS